MPTSQIHASDLLQRLPMQSWRSARPTRVATADDTFASFITPEPGITRPLLPKNDNFAVGTGPGTLHLRLLAEHVKKVLGRKAVWVHYDVEPMTFEGRPTDKQKMSP